MDPQLSDLATIPACRLGWIPTVIIRSACKVEKYPNHLGIVIFHLKTKLWTVFECPIDRIRAGIPLT